MAALYIFAKRSSCHKGRVSMPVGYTGGIFEMYGNRRDRNGCFWRLGNYNIQKAADIKQHEKEGAMKEAVILILSILVCYLLWRLFSIKYTLKKAEKELREISAEPEENRIVKFPVPDKTMEAFLCAVNENLEEIRKLRIAYAKKEENLKEEIENISHDLRTPLTAILGYLKMMDISSMSREEQESLKIVRKKSEELQKLIGQFYELSRVSDGNFQMKLEETNAGRILRECCLSHYGLLEKLKVELFIPEMPVNKGKSGGTYKSICKSSSEQRAVRTDGAYSFCRK